MSLPDSDSLSTYIGAPQLIDFSAVVDPNTDVSAAGLNQALCTLAMSSLTIPRAIVSFVDTGSTLAFSYQQAVWGNDFSVQPTLGNSGTGLYSITWPATVSDQLAISHSVNLVQVISAQVMTTGAPYFCSAALSSSNSVSIRIHNASASLATPTGLPITIVVR